MKPTNKFPNTRPGDRNFFLVMLLIIWAAILSGFGYDIVQKSAHSTLHFPLIVHIHAAFFVGWLLLFTVQIWLIRGKHVKLHKKLGLAGFAMIPVMVLLGILAALVSEHEKYGTPDFDAGFIATMFADVLIFGALAGAGMWLRKDPAAHKRLLLVATIAICDAGFGRWFSLKTAPLVGDMYWNIHSFDKGILPYFVFQMLPSLTLMLVVGVYDLITRKKLHPAYIGALLFWLCVNFAASYLYFNGEWIRLATGMVGH